MLVLALLGVATVYLQRLATRLQTVVTAAAKTDVVLAEVAKTATKTDTALTGVVDAAAKTDVVLAEVQKTTTQTETLVNSQRSALEAKILLLEQKIEASILAAVTAAQATAAIVLQGQQSMAEKDAHIASLLRASVPPGAEQVTVTPHPPTPER